jgi:hypothetical protein
MSLISQTTAYTTPGTYTYTIPQGVSALELYLWGAGGANGAAGEVVSRQTGQKIVGSVQTGTQVTGSVQTGTREVGQVEVGKRQVGTVQTGTKSVGTVVVQPAIPAGQQAVSERLVVPEGVTSVTILAAGGGGGGGGSDGFDKNHHIYGAGGQAGALVQTTVAVTPGQVITATVGGGGGGGAGGNERPGASGGTTVVAVEGTIVARAAGGAGGAARVTGSASNGARLGGSAAVAGGGGAGSPGNYRSDGLSGQSGAVIVAWDAVPEVTRTVRVPVYEPVYEPIYEPIFEPIFTPVVEAVFEPVYEPIFTYYPGGTGGAGGAGGYANRKIRVTQGDVVVVSVGGAGINYVGGSGASTPTNFSGGTAGVATGTGRGGGGGGATVVTVNGVVVAVAAGGGGGGAGGTNGVGGANGTGAEISGGTGGTSAGANSATGPSTGGGGGGGYFGGVAGTSGVSGGGGQGGISYGTIIQAGTTAPGGLSVSLYPSTRPGYPERNGAAVLTFTKSFNINVKQSNNWKSVDRAWVKVSGIWKELLNGWTKVDGSWAPLITARSIEGAENLAAPTVVYTLTRDVSSVDEGDTVTFTLGGTGLTNGTVVPYTATGIDANALAAGALSGNFIVGTTNSITFTPKLNQTTYGARTLKVFLDNKGVSASCIVNNISLTPLYTLTASTPTVTEGSTVTFTLSTANVDNGEVIAYSVSGIAAADLSSGSLTGNFIVGTTDSIALTLSADSITEGAETLTMTLHNRPGSASCIIIDSSITPTPTYALSASTSSVNEGGSVTFTLSTTNVNSGTVVPYSISGVSFLDLTSGSINGNFVVGSVTTATFTLASDNRTEGREVITMTLVDKGITENCIINDSSTTPPIPFTGSITLSGSGVWAVPPYVNTVFVSVTGGGGGGGANHSSCGNSSHHGGNGGGGYTNSDTLSVSSGQTFNYSVGGGGGGGATSKASGSPGGATSFGSVSAAGGSGGIGGTSGAVGAGGGAINGGKGGVYQSWAGSAGGSGSISLSWSGVRPG